MVKTALLIALAAGLSLPATAGPAVLSAPAMYADTLAKEEAVRQALNSAQAPAALLKAARTVVTQYEALVRHYPTSGYADDALWNAAQLSLEAYRKLGQPRDGAAAVRLLKRVSAEYPTSRFARRAPDVLKSLDVRAIEAARASEIAGSAEMPAPPEVPRSGDVTRAPQQVPPADASAASGRATAVNRAAAVKPASSVATLTRIRRVTLPDVVRVTIEVDNEVAFKQEQLSGPPRIYFDFAATRPAPDLADRTLRFEGDADIVRQIRVGRHVNTTTRVVFDTAGSSDCGVSPMYEPYRLVVDCVRETRGQAPVAQNAAPPLAIRPVGAPGHVPLSAGNVLPTKTPAIDTRSPKAEGATPAPAVATRRTVPSIVFVAPLQSRAAAALWSAAMPSGRPSIEPAVLRSALVEASLVAVSPVVAPAANGPTHTRSVAPPADAPRTRPAPPVAPARNLGGGFSMARQLGLGVSRIVIDPGHGGHDPGAKGSGITEASLVLDIALRVEKLLAQAPGMEVVLTRRSDEFVSLEERTAIANRESADLFLSIHANAAASAQAGGVETYFLDFATSAGAASVAARENAAAGHAMNALPDFVKAITLNNKLAESRDFATYVQRTMMQKLKGGNTAVRDLGVKQAPFVVLIGASMPSVLAEVSFVTNEREARLLRGQGYRQRIAEALYAAIQKYQASLTRVGNLAQQ